MGDRELEDLERRDQTREVVFPAVSQNRDELLPSSELLRGITIGRGHIFKQLLGINYNSCHRVTVEWITSNKRSRAKKVPAVAFNSHTLLIPLRALRFCVRRERQREREKEKESLLSPPPHTCYCYSPVPFLGLPFLPLTFPSPSSRFWISPFFRPKVATGGSCLSFLSPPHSGFDSAITSPVFYLEFFALNSFP